MLQITVEGGETYDEEKNLFSYGSPFELRLEHSLVSISKWEMKWELPYLKTVEKKKITDAQFKDYIRCMTMNQNVPEDVYDRLSFEQYKKISEYTKRKMSASWINKGVTRHSSETVTSELIYYWMFSFNIPKECEKWHLNRLLMLIDIFAVKNQPNNKMSKADIYKQNAALNAARKAKYHTKG